MMGLVGRLFMLIGMLLLPVGLSIGMFQDDVKLEVRLLFIGGAFFVAGWLMAKRRS